MYYTLLKNRSGWIQTRFIIYDSFFPLDRIRIVAILGLQLHCLVILLFIHTIFRKNKIQEELDMLNRLWHEQREQYDRCSGEP